MSNYKKHTNNRRVTERQAKAVVREIKRQPKWVIIVAVILIAVFLIYYFCKIKNKPDIVSGEIELTQIDNELSIHFFMFNNNANGDSIYIKAGDKDILIDGGAQANNVNAIKNYVNQYCTDGILEYVIVTHADSDHIACFASATNIFSLYECQTIIDFPRTDKTTTTYNNYVANRDAEVQNGAKHFTALECYNNVGEAKRDYDLSSNITMSVLYQKYYEQSSPDENNYSVCVMFKHGDRNFLFTGDLEEDGEKSLVESNTLPEVVFFKAGHHGSKTSSNDVLLNVIKPKICVVSCSAGYKEYKNVFPTQDFINRISKHTANVYIPTLGDPDFLTGGDKYAPLNGNIRVVSKENKVSVYCSGSDKQLKDTEWFKAKRTCPATWAS